MTNATKIVTGFLTGTALGLTLGLLFAPKKGSKTRSIIAAKAKRIVDSSAQAYSKSKDFLGIKENKPKETVMN